MIVPNARAATFTVGAGEAFTTLSSAVAPVNAGDTINLCEWRPGYVY